MTDAALPTRANDSRRLPAGLLTTFAGALVAGLSFVPPAIKHALHTQGELHLWYHVLAFAALAFLFLSRASGPRARFLLPFAALAVGWGTEFAQAAVYHYSVERPDLAADAMGVLLGVLVFHLAQRSVDAPTPMHSLQRPSTLRPVRVRRSSP